MAHELHTICIPVGNSTAILIIMILMSSLLHTFKSNNMSRKMKFASVYVFITIICYDISQILQKSVLSNQDCNIGKASSFCSFLLSRAALYYFFIMRIEVSFINSEMQFSPQLLRILKCITIAVYFSTSVFYVATFTYWTYDVEQQRCWPANDTVLLINFIVSILYGVTDLSLGVVLCTLYLYRLRKVYHMMKASHAFDYTRKDNPNKQLMCIIKKQAKLAYIAYISSLIFIVIGPPLGFNWCPYVDSVVSALCVYCTFDLNKRLYQYLCNCNGNRYLLYAFCVLGCCCCNEPHRSITPDLKVMPSSSVPVSVPELPPKSGPTSDDNKTEIV
eukprot:237753_1